MDRWSGAVGIRIETVVGPSHRDLVIRPGSWRCMMEQARKNGAVACLAGRNTSRDRIVMPYASRNRPCSWPVGSTTPHYGSTPYPTTRSPT